MDFPNRINDHQARTLAALMLDGTDALNMGGNPDNAAELITFTSDGAELDDGARTLVVMALEPNGQPEDPHRGWTIPPAGPAWPVDNDLQAEE